MHDKVLLGEAKNELKEIPTRRSTLDTNKNKTDIINQENKLYQKTIKFYYEIEWLRIDKVK